MILLTVDLNNLNDPNDMNDWMTESFADDWPYGIYFITYIQHIMKARQMEQMCIKNVAKTGHNGIIKQIFFTFSANVKESYFLWLFKDSGLSGWFAVCW